MHVRFVVVSQCYHSCLMGFTFLKVFKTLCSAGLFSPVILKLNCLTRYISYCFLHTSHLISGPTGVHPGSECSILDAVELRFFNSCQSRSAEAVREVTEFAKTIPGFIDLDLNDQVRSTNIAAHEFCHSNLDIS